MVSDQKIFSDYCCMSISRLVPLPTSLLFLITNIFHLFLFFIKYVISLYCSFCSHVVCIASLLSISMMSLPFSSSNMVLLCLCFDYNWFLIVALFVFFIWYFMSQLTSFRSYRNVISSWDWTSTKQRIKSLTQNTTQCLEWVSKLWTLYLMSSTLPLSRYTFHCGFVISGILSQQLNCLIIAKSFFSLSSAILVKIL